MILEYPFHESALIIHETRIKMSLQIITNKFIEDFWPLGLCTLPKKTIEDFFFGDKFIEDLIKARPLENPTRNIL